MGERKKERQEKEAKGEDEGEGEGKGREDTSLDGAGVNQSPRTSRTLKRRKNGMETPGRVWPRGCSLGDIMSISTSLASQPLAPTLGARYADGAWDSGPRWGAGRPPHSLLSPS